ncbi:MAG: response regulator transcription factor [Myxococcales bacterium]|nr:response regulator transcription factor [Myxococcales bacterium]
MSGAPESDPAPRVLLVEDEASIRRGLLDVFRYRGCQVVAVADGAEALRLGLEERWDLVVLDIMLPELNGFAVCERLRGRGREMPILMLTAKGDEDDIVRGFEVGANDYVTKPFGVRELTARANALLRRSPRAMPQSFRAGPLEVTPERREARVDGATVELTAREIRILRILSLEPGHIVSRRTLLRDAWDMNNSEQLETRTVDVHIAKLRKKLGEHGALIATVRGEGYRLEH